MRRAAAALVGLVGLGLAGCPGRLPAPKASSFSTSKGATTPPNGSPPPFLLVDVAAQRGITFRHENSPRSPLGIVETLGSGAVAFDYDKDGAQDILLISAGQDFKKPRQESRSRLYHNRGDGHFDDVTASSGLEIDGYAMGACIGDYDNDGLDDLAVTGFGRAWLFRNRGGGKFTDVTRAAGIPQRAGAWGMGCAFVDTDRDGFLDLYIANYVRYDPKIPFCRTAKVWHGCTPNQYTTQANELYINRRNGTFVERAAALGATDPEGAGLGVVTCDFDEDGWVDIFVANDGTPNGLLHNQHGRFVNIGHQAGVAFGDDGTMRAGMGTDAGDFDGDGHFDLSITNFQNEVTAVYRNAGQMVFQEVSHPTGVGAASLNHLKFGVAWIDLDGDGKIDLYQGNGHVHDNISQFNDFDTFEQIDQVYLNQGEGRFQEVLPQTGAFPSTPSVTRAVAVADFNNDGRADLLINSLGRPARLLENQTKAPGRWLGLQLEGTRSNRSAIGARIELKAPGGLQVREVRSGGGYLGQSDLRPLFRVPAGTDPATLSVRIRWPNGSRQTWKPTALDRYVRIKEMSQ